MWATSCAIFVRHLLFFLHKAHWAGDQTPMKCIFNGTYFSSSPPSSSAKDQCVCEAVRDSGKIPIFCLYCIYVYRYVSYYVDALGSSSLQQLWAVSLFGWFCSSSNNSLEIFNIFFTSSSKIHNVQKNLPFLWLWPCCKKRSENNPFKNRTKRQIFLRVCEIPFCAKSLYTFFFAFSLPPPKKRFLLPLLLNEQRRRKDAQERIDVSH